MGVLLFFFGWGGGGRAIIFAKLIYPLLFPHHPLLFLRELFIFVYKYYVRHFLLLLLLLLLSQNENSIDPPFFWLVAFVGVRLLGFKTASLFFFFFPLQCLRLCASALFLHLSEKKNFLSPSSVCLENFLVSRAGCFFSVYRRMIDTTQCPLLPS